MEFYCRLFASNPPPIQLSLLPSRQQPPFGMPSMRPVALRNFDPYFIFQILAKKIIFTIDWEIFFPILDYNNPYRFFEPSTKAILLTYCLRPRHCLASIGPILLQIKPEQKECKLVKWSFLYILFHIHNTIPWK